MINLNIKDISTQEKNNQDSVPFPYDTKFEIYLFGNQRNRDGLLSASHLQNPPEMEREREREIDKQ